MLGVARPWRALFVHRGVASSAASVVALPLPRRAAMDDYPKKEHVRGREMRCHFHDCGKDFAHFRSLVAHLRTRHGVAKDELAGHWVHAEYLRERRSAAVLGVREAEFVSIAQDDEGLVDEKRCVCIPCAKVIVRCLAPSTWSTSTACPRRSCRSGALAKTATC